MITYAGIGSREINEEEIKRITAVGEYLAQKELIQFSGNAEGSDITFQKASGGRCVIFLPWANFNNEIYDIKKSLASYVVGHIDNEYINLHPKVKAEKGKKVEDILNNSTRKFMNRNSFQITGYNEWPEVKFVVCCADPLDPPTYVSGGTGQAVRIAHSKNIPVINLRLDNWKDDFISIVNNIITTSYQYI